MSQQKLKNFFTQLKSIQSSPQLIRDHEDHQQWLINKQEFSHILEKFVQKQQHLQQNIQNLQREVKSLKDVQTSFFILSESHNVMKVQQEMKDKLILNLQKYCQNLEEQLTMYRKQHVKTNQQTSKCQSRKFNENNFLMSNKSSTWQDDSRITERSFREQRRGKKICLKKKKNNHGIQANLGGIDQKNSTDLKDLEIARLSSQLSKLKNKLWKCETKITILQIQNQHLLAQTQTIYKRQRFLQQSSYNQPISIHSKPHTKAQYKQSSYFNYLASSQLPQQICRFQSTDICFKKSKQNSVMPVSSFQHKTYEAIAPPITPHFSSDTLNLSYFPKHKTQKMDSSFFDELLQVCSQDQSDRLQSQQIFEQTDDDGFMLKQL